MNSLFIRIFLWFWAAMVALVLTLAWTTAQLGGREIPPMLEHARESFQSDVKEAVRTLSRQGVAGLRRWYDDDGHRRVLSLYLLDGRGQDLLGQPLPPRLRRFAFMPEAYLREVPEIRRQRVIVHSVTLPGRGYLRLVASFRPPHPVWYLFTPARLIVALLVSGLICWGLAAYLSRPVRALRQVTGQWTEGDLSARVSEKLLRRRDELGGLANDLNAMASRLQALLAAQRQLLADVSHELRSPLARLQLAIGLAQQRSQGVVDDELLQIERESERLNELIGEVLTLTRLSADAELVLRPMVLADVIDAVISDAAFEANSVGRAVRLLGEAPDVEVSGDPQLLHRAIENIVRNAIRYTAEGTTVELSVRLLERPQQAAAVEIVVRDYGPGIDEAMVDKVFEPFVRVQSARDRDSGGYGLGLSIARRAILAHGGTVVAENLEDGLQVRIVLPVMASSAASSTVKG